MKLKTSIAALFTLCAVGLAACGGGKDDDYHPADTSVTGVSLNEHTVELEVNQTFQLTATVSPSNATNQSVTWSSDSSLVTVADGLVTAGNTAGTAVVTVTTVDGNFTDTCTFTIKEGTTPPVETNIEAGEEGTKAPDTWIYWADQNWCGSTVTVSTHKKVGDTLQFAYTTVGNCDFGFQVFYKNSQNNEGASYRLSAKITTNFAVTAASQLVKINGTYVDLVNGDNNIAVKYVEGGASASSFQLVVSTAASNNATITISDITWEGILDIPGNIAISDTGVITFNKVDGAASYDVYYYTTEGQYVDKENIADSGATLTKFSSLVDGKYFVYLEAISSLDAKYNSIRSAAYTLKIGDEEDIPAGGPKTDIAFGANGELPVDKFVYWNDQWWCGSNVVVSEAYTENGEVHATYTAEGACDFAFQIFYYNSSLKADKEYTLTFNATLTNAARLKANTEFIDLPAGTTQITQTISGVTAGNTAIWFALNAVSNTVVLSGFSWVEK